ncbi:MAG: ABC transporter ATP-binding protein [Solirubrobacteraceae bacterium]|nr:ABC transporter ATP-binding protein [Solirubrobacteraceae bacterium]
MSASPSSPIGGRGPGNRRRPTDAQIAAAAPTEPVDRRRILGLFRPHRKKISVVAGLIAASALIGLAQPFLLREIIDVALPEKDTTLLTYLVLGMVGAALIGAVIDVWQSWLSNIVGQNVMHGLRASVYDHLQKMSLAFFTKTRGGEVQSRIANDIGAMQGVVTQSVTQLVGALTTVIATLTAMLVLDWRLAAATLVVVPFFVWLSRTVGQQRRKITTVRQARLADMSAIVEETLSIGGVVLARTMGRAGDLSGKFGATSSDVADLEVRSAMAGRWRMATVQLAFAGMPALVYWIAGWANAQGSGFVSIGTIVAFTTLQTRLLMPMITLLRLGVQILSSLALFTRVFDYLDTPVDLIEPEHPEKIDAASAEGNVEIEDVSFAYDDRSGDVLSGVSLSVPAGTTLALVGATGSGKTTLGYLIARLYDVERGRITIDGHDLRSLSLDSRAELVGVVSQETHLLHATVADNLRFAKPDATDEELHDAARAAQIHDLLIGLPDGYDTVVGERGYRFSGGERQRLAIARIVLRDPPILVLDEATSALDTRTEHAVQEALDRLSDGRTTIAIAHRLSTIQGAEQIAVLDHGEVIELGSHDDLATRGGPYSELLAGSLRDEARAQAAEAI